MKKMLLLCLIVISLQVQAQDVTVVSFSELQEKMLYTEAPLTVFNFWATWCGPCIKEIPHFEELASDSEDVKVYLVSVDFKQDLNKVELFAKKRNLQSSVIFLNEKDPDEYMPKVSHEWTGAIPATLFVTDLGKTFFHEKAFTKEELEQTVKKYLN